MATTVTVNDVLDGHVVLDMECLDRIYLNGYVPNLQMGGQVVSFLTQHLGNPIPSPAIRMAQEFAPVYTATKHTGQTSAVWFYYAVSQRPVSCYYLYLWDNDFGPAFIKVCAYFPYPMKIWVN